MNIADIVISLNGRDAGKRFCVIGSDDEYSLIADGKGRRVEKPKRKKNKHLKFEGKAGGNTAKALTSGETISNSELRKMLAAYADSRNNGQATDDKQEKSEAKGGVPKCQKTT